MVIFLKYAIITQYLVLLVYIDMTVLIQSKQCGVVNSNFPPQEKIQLPLEFENNKLNHDLRFFFNKPVWCSWTFPVKNQTTQTHQLLELFCLLKWHDFD